MNRRTFIQSLAAVLSIPSKASLTLQPTGNSLAAATAVPAKARSWATYISALHGECAPQTLQNLLHIPAAEANKYIGQLVAEGAISPVPILKNTASKLAKSDGDNPLDVVKNRIEKKARAKVKASKVNEPEEDTGPEAAEAETLEDDQVAVRVTVQTGPSTDKKAES